MYVCMHACVYVYLFVCGALTVCLHVVILITRCLVVKRAISTIWANLKHIKGRVRGIFAKQRLHHLVGRSFLTDDGPSTSLVLLHIDSNGCLSTVRLGFPLHLFRGTLCKGRGATSWPVFNYSIQTSRIR